MTVQQPCAIQSHDHVHTGRNEKCRKVQHTPLIHGHTNVDSIPNSRDQGSGHHEQRPLLPPVTEVRDHNVRRAGPEEDRNRQQLSRNNSVSKASNDQRQERAQAKRADIRHKLRPTRDVKLRISDGAHDLFPVKVRLAIVPRIDLGAHPHHRLFVLVEEPSVLKVIGEHHVCERRHENRRTALNDEEPAPTLETTDTVHLEECVREEAAKGSTECGGDEEV